MSRRNMLLIGVEIGTTIAIVLALWRYSQTHQSYIVSSFSDIWREFKDAFLFDRISSDVLPTLRRIGLSFGLATLIGAPLGLALGTSLFLRHLTAPLLAFFRALPPIALIPPAIVLIGIGDNMKVMLTVFVALWPIALNTADGAAEVNQTVRDTASTFRLTAWQRMRYVTIPSVAPRTFAGMHIALAFVVIGIIATEYLAGSEGIGYIVVQASQTLQTPLMWAGIVLLGIMGFLLNTLFVFVQRRVLYWVPDTWTRDSDSGP